MKISKDLVKKFKKATHCLKELDCNDCDYRLTCRKIHTHRKKGEILGYDGKWKKATEEDKEKYRRNFGSFEV